MENGDALYARIAELELENEKLKEQYNEKLEQYNDLWDYGRDDFCEVNIVKMLLEEGNKKRVMEVWSDVYELHRLTGLIDFEEDDEDEEEEEEVLEDLTCDQLKSRLRAINKPVGGRKADLIQRIREHERLTAALFKED